MNVLDGCVDILGKRVRRGEVVWRVISPSCNALLGLSNPSENEVTRVRLSSVRDGLEAMRFSNGNNVFDLLEGDSETFKVNPVGNYDKLFIPECWRQTASELDIVGQKGNPVILVCGPRKVGKSTFCRFLLNTLLNHRDGIYHMDLDPGQTEFMPPGFITLELTSEPLTSPPFGHAHSVRHSRYLGFTSVEENPEHYYECSKSLFEAFRACHPQLPLIINTMGWVTGLGLQLLQAIVQTVRPTHIVSFGSPRDNQIEPSESRFPEYVGQAMFSPCLLLPRHQFSVLSEERSPQQFVLKSMALGIGSGGPDEGSLSPRERRELMWFAYFHRIPSPRKLRGYDFTQPMSSFRPFRISWDNIVIVLTPSLARQAQKVHVPALLIGSVVGLCRSSIDPEIPARSTSFPRVRCLLYEEEPANCLAAALVRSIDMNMRTIEIWTPHELEFLESNLLYTLMMHPGFLIPPSLFLRESQSCGGPYLSVASVYSLALAPHVRKVRTNIRRKWQPS